MGSARRPGRDRRWRRRRVVVVSEVADADRWRRLVILGLLVALLMVGGVTGILRATSARHPAAAAARPAATAPGLLAYGLIGGGGVRPRRATGILAITGSVGQILFAENGTALDQYAQAVIDNAALAIRVHHLKAVTVTGYTNTIGNAPANQRLSLLRAHAVLRALRQHLRKTVISYRTRALGQTAPVAPDSTPAGRQLNRRVLITASQHSTAAE